MVSAKEIRRMYESLMEKASDPDKVVENSIRGRVAHGLQEIIIDKPINLESRIEKLEGKRC